jgi:hypothetical protein
MKARAILAAAVAAMVVTSTTRADGLGVAAKAGTLGFGAELGYRFNDYLGVRAGVNAGSYDFDAEDAGINYSYGMDFDTIPVMLDWYVFGGTFRLTGGYVNNKNKLTGTATGALDIGGGTYNTTATTDISFDKSSSYFGLGWGGLPSATAGFGMSFDIGVMMHGSPTAKLSAPGVPPGDIAAEEASLNDELKDLKYWPVISLGIGYTF